MVSASLTNVPRRNAAISPGGWLTWNSNTLCTASPLQRHFSVCTYSDCYDYVRYFGQVNTMSSIETPMPICTIYVTIQMRMHMTDILIHVYTES